MQLTLEQTQAVSHPCGNMQMIACAGSGKTEVVARRIVHLLKPEGGLKPQNIIAFTFTNKAAAELKDRVAQRCKEELGDVTGLAEMFVGTIHAYCLNLLTSMKHEYLKYDVLDDIGQILFIDRYSSQSGLTQSTDLNGNPLKRFEDTKRYSEALSILREANLNKEALNGCSIINGLKAYRALLEKERKLDYSSIQEAARDALKNDEDLRKHIAERIQYVIVDEYQDVNPIQEEIIRLLHELGAKVCVVGDDDQTIYQWRGSDIQNIVGFSGRYNDVCYFPLNENFRSSNGIVETARPFIERNPNRLRKSMKAADAQNYEPGDILALHFKSPEEEAAYIAETIISLRGIAIKDGSGKRGISWSDMAVLLRSVKRNGEPIKRAFEHAGIPFVVIGMTDLFGAPEAEAARQLFYYMDDRRNVDDTVLERAWANAMLGIEPSKLRGAIRNVSNTRASLAERTENTYRRYQLQYIFKQFLEDICLREEMVPDGRGEVVFYNLGKFSQLITDFESIHFHDAPVKLYEAFSDFLRYRAEDLYPEGWQDNQYLSPDAVRIMTVHQAKGMQWPVVFIPTLTRNNFPIKKPGGRSVWNLIPKASVIGQRRYESTKEDERRLFYVAMTRSQKFLFLTWAPVADNRLYKEASEFWNDVLSSRYVLRQRQDYTTREKLEPTPRSGVSNVNFSFSDLKYFFECPYMFKLRVLYGFDIPIDRSLGYGKSLHNVLADIHARAINGDIVKVDEAPNLIKKHLHTPYAYKSLREMLENSAEKVITNYISDNQKELKYVEFSEKQIEITLGDGVTVSGRIDLVRRLDTNDVYIVDLKTKDRPQAEEVTEDQLHIYALGYQELTGKHPDYLEMYDLDERKRNTRTVQDYFIEQVIEKIKTAAQSLRTGDMGQAPEPKKCKNCDYNGMCNSGCGMH